MEVFTAEPDVILGKHQKEQRAHSAMIAMSRLTPSEPAASLPISEAKQ